MLSVSRGCLRNIFQRSIFTTLCYNKEAKKKEKKEKAEKKEKKPTAMFTDLENLTGIAKSEYEAILGGDKDPFRIREVVKRGCGTEEQPTLIPSAFEGRLVGCVCHEYQRYVCWMWLEKETPKRCECGHWFKIDPIEPFYG